MNRKNRFLVGSYNDRNVQRICLGLEDKGEIVIVESWEDFDKESRTQGVSVRITDLNLVDCFQLVVLDNVQEQPYQAPVLVLLEDCSSYSLYRERAHPLIEIFPFEVVEDDRFSSVIDATRAKFDFLNELA